MANLKLYSYYSPGEENPQIVSVNAETILEADKLVKEMSHNPLRLYCCVGVRVVFVNTSLIKRFVQQNINRWIVPMKNVRKEAEAEALRDQDRYYEDMEAEFDRDYPLDEDIAAGVPSSD